MAFAVLLGSGFASASADNITGRVVNANGEPEAGVWVIAETQDLATPMRKIVVTDDAGRFAVPELPAVNFKVWVRGYGLRDSAPVVSGVPATMASR